MMHKVASDNGVLKLWFSATVGQEPEIELAPV